MASKRTVWAMLTAGVIGVGYIGGALGVIPYVSTAVTWIHDRWAGYVELPGTYPDEKWKPATQAQYSWLVDEWCYPSLRGFHSRFRIVNGVLQRQNQGSRPDAFTSDWISADAFISNRSVLRLRYRNSDWPGSYIAFQPSQPAEWMENIRYTDDQGIVTSGDKMLVLSCSRCRLMRGGLTYSCDPA